LLAGLVLFVASPAFPQEPPEEDVNPATVKEYTFNPLQAVKELKVGNYYFKKGSYRAAARRFEEALKWDPNSAEACLRLGDAKAKLGDKAGSRAAYEKYLEIDSDSRQADEIRKKLGKPPVKQPSGD
jgi:tetratricopeptide (TPR) repeat protein